MRPGSPKVNSLVSTDVLQMASGQLRCSRDFCRSFTRPLPLFPTENGFFSRIHLEQDASERSRRSLTASALLVPCGLICLTGSTDVLSDKQLSCSADARSWRDKFQPLTTHWVPFVRVQFVHGKI